MSWAAHVSHGYTTEGLSKKFGATWEANLTSAHLAGADGTVWGHHGDAAHNFTLDDINKLKGANPGSMVQTSIFPSKLMCINKIDDSVGFKSKDGFSCAIFSGKTYTTLVVAADTVPNCIDAVEAFAAYMKKLNVE